MKFSRPENWSGWLFPSPRDLPNPGTEPKSPALQADSLPAEPQGKPMQRQGGKEKPGESGTCLLPAFPGWGNVKHTSEKGGGSAGRSSVS